jgi:hypothetical protein
MDVPDIKKATELLAKNSKLASKDYCATLSFFLPFFLSIAKPTAFYARRKKTHTELYRYRAANTHFRPNGNKSAFFFDGVEIQTTYKQTYRFITYKSAGNLNLANRGWYGGRLQVGAYRHRHECVVGYTHLAHAEKNVAPFDRFYLQKQFTAFYCFPDIF